MNDFSADWLALRERFDREARAETFDLSGFAARLMGEAPVLTVLDLACGTGANLREIALRLGGAQRWTLVDHDARLLAALPKVFAPWAQAMDLSMHLSSDGFSLAGRDLAIEVELRCHDLARQLDATLFERHRLITASALLDLVSARWIDAFATRARAAGAAVLLGLSVDGSVEWQPALAGDEEVHRLFVAHQGRDKGFGPALGGRAVEFAAERLAALGYEVACASSDWRIDGREGAHSIAMLRAMIEGASKAALEQEPAASGWLEDWTARRLGVIERTRLRVGHFDLLATLP